MGKQGRAQLGNYSLASVPFIFFVGRVEVIVSWPIRRGPGCLSGCRSLGNIIMIIIMSVFLERFSM